MCEILIKAVDNIGVAIEGDFISINEDAHVWGRKESKAQWLTEGRNADDWPNYFFVIKVPNTAANTVKQYIENKFPNFTGTIHIDKTDIPQTKRIELRDNGETTVTAQNLINYLRNR